MDENRSSHPSSNLILRFAQRFCGARNLHALLYAAEKTAQKSRELIEFKKDRLEVSAITAKTLREPCSRICSVAGAIRSLWLILLRCRGTLKDSTCYRHHHYCRRCVLIVISNQIGLCNRSATFYENFLNIEPRNRASAPSAPQACLIVITYIATLRNSDRIISGNQMSDVLQTSINIGQSACRPKAL